MYRRTFVIPIFVFILFSFVLFFYQKYSVASTYAVSSPIKTVPLNKTASDIIALEYKWSDGSIATSREDNVWSITSPAKATGDASYIYSIISKFTTPGNLHLIESNIEDTSYYGIDAYSPSLIFSASDGSTYEIIKGYAIDEVYDYVYNPLDQSIYAVSKELFNHLSKDLTTWFNKDFLGFKESEINEITISFKGNVHTITPMILHNQLTFSSSTLSEADVQVILNFLSTTKATSYVVDHASEQIIESYGFNNSPIELVLHLNDSTKKTFFISTSFSSPDSQYILIKDNNTIITINSVFTDIPKEDVNL